MLQNRSFPPTQRAGCLLFISAPLQVVANLKKNVSCEHSIPSSEEAPFLNECGAGLAVRP